MFTAIHLCFFLFTYQNIFCLLSRICQRDKIGIRFERDTILSWMTLFSKFQAYWSLGSFQVNHCVTASFWESWRNAGTEMSINRWTLMHLFTAKQGNTVVSAIFSPNHSPRFAEDAPSLEECQSHMVETQSYPLVCVEPAWSACLGVVHMLLVFGVLHNGLLFFLIFFQLWFLEVLVLKNSSIVQASCC